MADDSAHFAKASAHNKDLHRRLGPGDDLEDVFAWKEERTQWRGADPAIRQDPVHSGAGRAGQGGDRQAGQCVTVVDPSDSRPSIRYRGVKLAYRFRQASPGRSGVIADRLNLYEPSGLMPAPAKQCAFELPYSGRRSGAAAGPSRAMAAPSMRRFAVTRAAACPQDENSCSLTR